MSPKAGTQVSLVAPVAPIEVKEAADSVAGKVDEPGKEEANSNSSSTDSTKVNSTKAGASEETPPEKFEPDKSKKGWIEILLKDEEGTPQGGTRYKITLPDGSVADGTLDDKGKARVDGFDSGQCKVEFQNLDEKVWKEK
jgi:type VI secretion system secreted protein VgrG